MMIMSVVAHDHQYPEKRAVLKRCLDQWNQCTWKSDIA